MEPLKLTPAVVSQTDINRLMRELTGLNDFFVGARTRAGGSAMQLPKLSRLMDQLSRENSVNLLEEADRKELMRRLETLYKTAPSFHISFAVEPSPKSMERIVVWMRQNVHPQTLLSVGLQPAIAAGCVLRTTNKVFDMSLRNHLQNQTKYLAELIQGAPSGR
jgi:F0F1-type ATP synthase delta subunit